MQQVSLPLQGIYFCYYFWICTLTNSKYLQILCILYKKNHTRNNYEMILTKMIKNDKRTLKNKIHSTLIYVFTYYFSHISYFASFYFALTQYIHDIDWNTLNLEMTVWSGDLLSPLMAIFILFVILFFSRKEHGLTCNFMKIQVFCWGRCLTFSFCIFTDKNRVGGLEHGRSG